MTAKIRTGGGIRAEIGNPKINSIVKNNDYLVVPATSERWSDLCTIMGAKGGSGGCWCMLWRLPRRQYEYGKETDNQKSLERIVKEDQQPGLLAYCNEKPIGWCSVAPRTQFPQLEKSRVLKPIDDQEVWSITCFVIEKSFRRKGVSVALLKAACNFVRDRGGKILEGYPVDVARKDYPSVYAWVGLSSAFISAGFHEAARNSPTRPIMRKIL
jgi:GNAT superfamily N-acetyltransferase